MAPLTMSGCSWVSREALGPSPNDLPSPLDDIILLSPVDSSQPPLGRELDSIVHFENLQPRLGGLFALGVDDIKLLQRSHIHGSLAAESIDMLNQPVTIGIILRKHIHAIRTGDDQTAM